MLRKRTTPALRPATVLVIAGALLVFLGPHASADETDPLTGSGSDNEFSEVVDGDFTFRWRVDGDELEAVMSAPTTGYVSVGFHPTVMMMSAEIVIGYVENGVAHIQHHFGTGPVSHESLESLGEEGHVTVVDASEVDGVTTIRFRMPLSYGGEYDRPLVPGESTPVIWAYGPDGANNFADYHGDDAGSFEIDL